MIKKLAVLVVGALGLTYGIIYFNNTKRTSTPMTYLANRLSVIKPSPTLAIMGEASKRKALGEDIIILAAGEPDFDTPDHIKEAATQGMREGKTKYTAVDGMPDLKKAVQKKFFEDNGLSYDLSEILVGVGGKQVIFNALMATCNEGDEVIIPAPYWVSYPDMAKLFGAKPVFISCSEKDHFKVTPENLKKALTPKTKWLILNSPSNPTGSVYTRDELVALGNVLKDHTCLILSDDIYEYLTYDGEFVTLATACPEIKSRCLIVNGVSKAYSMTGWRIGYGAGPADLIKAMGMIQSQSTSNASSISQVAAIKALTSSRDFLGDWKKSFIERRDFCLDKINAIEGLSCRKPEGAFYLYINCEKILGKKTSEGNIIATDADFAAYLLNAVGVAVVPGDAFGLSPFVRISYATSMNELEKACQRIKKAVASLV